MNSTEKLLSITNLKKYFPIGRTSFFGKEQLYVRANEDITLHIMRGETVSLVGESGCGKSTFGRTVLQLYRQTAGSAVYYGRTLDDFAPAYVARTLENSKKIIKELRKKEERAKALQQACLEEGDEAAFFQIQDKNLALAEAETARAHVVKILGGFATLDDPTEGVSLLLQTHLCAVRMKKLRGKLALIQNRMDLIAARIEQIETAKIPDPKRLVRARRELIRYGERKARVANALEAETRTLEAHRAALDTLRLRYRDNADFMEYEGMLDDGIDLSRLSTAEMRLLRRDLQIIFQDPYSSLDPRMTVGQIIEEGLVTHNFFRQGSVEMRDYILDVMRRCGLQDYMLHRYPHQFSGGQRQRICIARSLAVRPKFVVCDECVSALDVSIQSQIINLLVELKKKENLTYLFISHDLSVVRYISDRIGVMYLGHIVELCDTETLFADPRHPYTVALLSSIPSTDPDKARRERIFLEGNIPSPIRPPKGCKFHTRCYMACDVCRRVSPSLLEIETGHYVACHFPERKLTDEGEYLFEQK